MKKTVLALLLAGASLASSAAPTVFGTFNVNDGPHWGTNPTVYSAREAAAFIFGGNYTDYFVSTSSTTITHTAYYDGWGDHTSRIFNEDFKLDFGTPGYNSPDPCATNCSASYYLDANGFSKFAYSAYVRDGISQTNYVYLAAAVPEPETYAMLLSGLGVLGLAFKRRNKK